MRSLIALTISVIAIAVAAPASADDSSYLQYMRQEYFTHSFTDAQLLSEGKKVCDLAGQRTDDSLNTLVQVDMGISEPAAATLIDKAHVWLGC